MGLAQHLQGDVILIGREHGFLFALNLLTLGSSLHVWAHSFLCPLRQSKCTRPLLALTACMSPLSLGGVGIVSSQPLRGKNHPWFLCGSFTLQVRNPSFQGIPVDFLLSVSDTSDFGLKDKRGIRWMNVDCQQTQTSLC